MQNNSTTKRGHRFQDLTGQVFHRLTVLECTETNPRAKWKCQCLCGATTIVFANNLKRGHTTSCGCHLVELNQTIGQRTRTHGMKHTVEYETWCHIKARCYKPADKAYANYGGRGIKVCDRWLHSFENFLEDMGPRPAGYSLERKDVHGPYEPSNCIWIPMSEQASNKRNTIYLSFNGQTRRMREWSVIVGIDYHCLFARYQKGWPDGKILTTPSRKRTKR